MNGFYIAFTLASAPWFQLACQLCRRPLEKLFSRPKIASLASTSVALNQFRYLNEKWFLPPIHTLSLFRSFSLSLSLSLTYLSLSLFVSYSLCFYTHCLFMPLCHSQRFLLLFWSATLNISISHYWTISFYVYFSLVLFICVSYLLSMSLILYLYLLPTLCVFVPVSFTFSPSHSSDVLSSSESCKNLRNVISCHAVAFQLLMIKCN